MEKLSWSASDLPDSLVRKPPVPLEPFEYSLHVLPALMGDSVAVLICQVYRIHHLAIDIELQLLISRISNAHRPRILVSAEMIQGDFVQLLAAIQAIHYLQWPALG